MTSILSLLFWQSWIVWRLERFISWLRLEGSLLQGVGKVDFGVSPGGLLWWVALSAKRREVLGVRRFELFLKSAFGLEVKVDDVISYKWVLIWILWPRASWICRRWTRSLRWLSSLQLCFNRGRDNRYGGHLLIPLSQLWLHGCVRWGDGWRYSSPLNGQLLLARRLEGKNLHEALILS